MLIEDYNRSAAVDERCKTYISLPGLTGPNAEQRTRVANGKKQIRNWKREAPQLDRLFAEIHSRTADPVIPRDTQVT
jgi:hypothetical protein